MGLQRLKLQQKRSTQTRALKEYFLCAFYVKM